MSEPEIIEETAEQLDARMQQALDVSARTGRPAMEAAQGSHSPRPRRVKLPDLPAHFGYATPKDVVAAWSAVQEEGERADQIVAELEEVGGRASTVQAAYLRQVRLAEADGTPQPRPPKATDDEAQILTLQARHGVRADAFREAVSAFHEAMQAAAPEWLGNLVEMQEPARQAAREALAPDSIANVHEADRLVRSWWALLGATEALWGELNPRSHGPSRSKGLGAYALQGAIGTTMALLASDDEALDARWMQDPLEVPLYVRKQWASSGGGAFQELLQIELAERFTVSDFTKPYADANGLSEVKVTPSGVRFT